MQPKMFYVQRVVLTLWDFGVRRSVHVRSQRYVLHDTRGRTDASWDTLRTWRTDPEMHLEQALLLEGTSVLCTMTVVVT